MSYDSLRAGSGWNILILLASCQQTFMTYTIAVCIVKTPDDAQKNRPKYVEFYSRNKFEKLVHLVGCIMGNKIYSFVRSRKLEPDVPGIGDRCYKGSGLYYKISCFKFRL
jgi:hypothetical protein